jgi:hypothetical protein
MSTPLTAIVTTLGIAAVAAPLSAFGVMAIQGNESPPLVVAIRLSIDSSFALRRITAQLKDEAQGLWIPYGIRLEWADVQASDVAAASISLDAAVERQLDRPRRLDWSRVLGWVVTNPGTPTRRSIHVSFDATENMLAQRMTGRRSVSGIVLDPELARALGRVLAHEIGHVLIGSGHDEAGLMRTTFDAEELAEPDRRPFRLTCSSADRLRSRLDALTGYTQRTVQQDSGPLDPEGPRSTEREFPGEAWCIARQH